MKEITSITVSELRVMSQRMYGELVKGVVDIVKQRLILDAELHADEEARLLETGSNQTDLWGINLYPDSYGTDEFIEFDSMINVRPSQNNRSRFVEDAEVRAQIAAIVGELVND